MHKNDGSLDLNKTATGLIEYLEKNKFDINEPQTDRLIRRIIDMMSYVPMVGILGKAGVGKSSICNAMFGSKVAETNEVLACTKKRADYTVNFTKEGKGIIFVDLPGMDDGQIDYSELYRETIPSLDLIVWVIAANDRALNSDLQVYNKEILPIITKSERPFIVVINQADLTHSDDGWDAVKSCPSAQQSTNLDIKRDWISKNFSMPRDRIISISAKKSYNLKGLLTLMIDVLPNARKIAIYKSATQENRSSDAKEKAEKGFGEAIWETIKDLGSAIKEIMIKSPTFVKELFSILADSL